MTTDPCAGVRQHLTELLDGIAPDAHDDNREDARVFVDAHVLPLVEAGQRFRDAAEALRKNRGTGNLVATELGEAYGRTISDFELALAAARAPKETRDGLGD